LQYADSKVIGNGSFGVVYRANLVITVLKRGDRF